jgi:hypothetical protein
MFLHQHVSRWFVIRFLFRSHGQVGIFYTYAYIEL